MKRLIEKYDHKFIKDDKRVWCTAINIPFNELPEDCSFGDYEVNIVNVLYDDCCIRIRKFDNNNNSIIIEIPNWIKEILFKSYNQGTDHCIEILHKLKYEETLVKNKQKIPYDNTVI